jgi:hypothetical protein
LERATPSLRRETSARHAAPDKPAQREAGEALSANVDGKGA